MKKITLFSLFVALTLLFSTKSNAQTIFSENFDGATPPNLPTGGWTQWNGDGLTVNSNLSTLNFGTNAWVSYKASGATDGYMLSTSWYSSPGTSNDWLISPSIAVPSTGSNFLIFETAAFNASFPDGFYVKISTTGNNPSTDFSAAAVLTVAAENGSWTTHAINLSAYAGQNIYVAIVNNSNDMYILGLNNFMVKTLPSNDLNFQAVTPQPSEYQSYATVGGTVSINGLVRNDGASTVTSYTVKVNDGATTTSFPQSVNITPYSTNIFNASYTMPSTGIKNMKIWVELTGDANHANDSLGSEFGGASFTPTHTCVFEEGTGCWCGWCVRGAVYMDSMHKVYPTQAAYIAVHDALNGTDPMAISSYDNGITSVSGFSGFPSVVIDRADVIDPSDLFTGYANHVNDFGVADLTLTASATGGVITANVGAHFAVDTKAAYDYRLALVVTEDNVHNTASTYDQHNYYAGQANSGSYSLPYGAGHDFHTETNPVPAAKMYYNFVAREIDGNNFGGTPSSLPATIANGSTNNHTFTWTIPTGTSQNNLRVIAMLISNLSGQAQNAKVADWVTGMNGLIANNELTVKMFPNPVENNLNLDINMSVTENVSFTLTNIMGQVVAQENLGTKTANEEFTHQINVSGLTNGTYILTVKTSKGSYTNKFIKE